MERFRLFRFGVDWSMVFLFFSLFGVLVLMASVPWYKTVFGVAPLVQKHMTNCGSAGEWCCVSNSPAIECPDPFLTCYKGYWERGVCLSCGKRLEPCCDKLIFGQWPCALGYVCSPQGFCQ